MTKFGPTALSFLENAEIIQVSIWKYGVKLRFDKKLSITIEGKVEIKSNGKGEVYNGQDGIVLGTRLLELLEHKVVAVAYEETNEILTLVFDNDIEMTLSREPNSPYESYQVGLPDGLLIV